MGIKQLGKFLKTNAPLAMNSHHCAHEYKDKTVAIDASPCLYQCMTAMGDTPVGVTPGSEADTSHILGFLRRTVRLLELGIKPIFVFDGDAPEMKKNHVLTHREKLRAKSREQLEEAKASGDGEAVKRHSARLVKTTQRHNDEVMELLGFMGVPAVQAPGEAECLCAALASFGKADAAATEDMDALVFGAPILLRNLHRGASTSQIPLVQEISLEVVLGALEFSQPEFMDFCILAGCDYLGTISRVGIMTAHQFVKKHRSIEAILENLDRKKHAVPEAWDFESARNCFKPPDMSLIEPAKLKPVVPDAVALRSLLVGKYSLNAETVDDAIKRLMLVKGGPNIQLIPRPLFVGKERRGDVEAGGSMSVNRGPDMQSQQPQARPGGPQGFSMESANLQRPMATPARSVKQRSRPSAPPLPKGQKTIAAVFAPGKRPAALVEASPQKRRRQAAIRVIEGQLGSGAVFPDTAALEILESLASELGTASSSESRGAGEVVDCS
mmetsp:Transcript_16390/g.28773  ORF Transcript_16390/g.28773 Transcript_16390/m.28773 type:complete len:498 (-) Transcript_16390:189-1682(-)|eukprot:CAMPEP_0197622794 /NCGR_PEP_ID=MMETSP1338-20131121/2939_1 /TAXON_ID=43686 ORGANISM="Pelagodinium beii, Strain RCC1491" /NCGR_SAMPLE_ID=MMETSP1338 /ASSEMBLY_ACC=CAM_ASM_000754 /LENGTH=497 /DNA_ID=CAMNT_0043192551 /DNA_START=63 /DNA_END=1556 /DNA_ORIENTATION=+